MIKNDEVNPTAGRQAGIYAEYFKRPMDIILSLIGLIVLFPVLLLAAILVRVKLGSPILFKQKRPGLNEKVFTMYKFRTMTEEKDENGALLPDSIRLTKFGALLRSTSLDELPELINILKGDMSVVGPRPLRVEYIPYYTEAERKRHSVRPGLSGLAQINGRNTATWEQRFHFDILYVEEITLMKDIVIILKTFETAMKRTDIEGSGLDSAMALHNYRKGLSTEEETMDI